MTSPALPRLFVLGDSISLHYGPDLERLGAELFQYDRKGETKGEGSAFDNLDFPKGANGGNSWMVLTYLQFRREHDPINADVLLLNCGLHDIKTDPETGAKQIPLPDYVRNLETILEEAAAMNMKVVWVRITPVIDDLHNTRTPQPFHRFARDVEDYNEAADAVMKAHRIPSIDLHSFTLPFLPDAFADHVHFDEAMRARQAAYIVQELRRLL